MMASSFGISAPNAPKSSWFSASAPMVAQRSQPYMMLAGNNNKGMQIPQAGQNNVRFSAAVAPMSSL
jgi:hypothetical protein